MVRYLIALLVCCCFFLAAPTAEAARFPVLGFPFRVGAKAVKVTAKAVTLPARAVRQVQVNSLERRACRGNKMAAARVEGVSSRKAARAKARCGC
jgi:hypothetical protein